MNTAMKLVLVCLCLSQITSAASEPPKLSIHSLVDHYYSQKKLFHNPPHCDEPVGPSCADVACTKLGPWGCDSLDEIKSVNTACRGNYDGRCLSAACDKLGPWGCDAINEITEVARACVGNYEMDCFDSVCQKLGPWGCDSTAEVTEVLRSCAGN